MIQRGQVFKLQTKGADGEPLWAYRYRLEGAARHDRRWEGSRAGLRPRRRSRRSSRGSAPRDVPPRSRSLISSMTTWSFIKPSG